MVKRSLSCGGGTSHIVEIERAFDDALGVVSLVINEAQVLVGGGATFADG